MKWNERIQDIASIRPATTEIFGATLTVEQNQVTEAILYANPLGLFVTNIDWQKEAGAL